MKRTGTTRGALRQVGFTLIELMVGLTVGLIVIGVVGAIFLNILRGSSDTMHSLTVNQEMRAVMALMVNDIRRAGYWGDAAIAAGSAAYDNPFTARTGAARDIFIHDNGSCVMYSYDIAHDGSTVPLMGFWLDGDSQRIQGIKGGVEVSGNGTADCGGDAGDAESFTDNRVVRITDLEFSTGNSLCRNLDNGDSWAAGNDTDPACDPGQPDYNAATDDRLVEIREITISMTGEHAENDDVQMSLEGDVYVRNNRLLLAP
jgi:type IV pilus assembly protein PilW